MAGKTAILAIQIVSDATKAARELDKTSQSVSRMGKASAAAGKIFAVGMLAVGAAAVKFGQAAADDELAAKKLANTMRNAAKATDSQVVATEKWITAQGLATGFSDSELRPALSKLVKVTGDVAKAQSLAALAMNVSADTGKSLESVSAAIAKAQTGQLTGLSKLGVATKNADGSTKSLHDVMADLAKLSKGAAANAADTNAGKQRILRVRLDELQESLGARVLPALLAVTSAGLAAVGWVEKHQTLTLVLVGVILALVAAVAAINVGIKVYTAVTAAWSAVTGIAAAVQAAFGAAALGTRIQLAALAVQTAVVAAATKAWAVVQAAFNIVMSANPIAIVILAIVALVAGIVLAYKKSETFRTIVQAVGKAAAAAFGWVVDKIKDIAKWVGQNVPTAFGTFKDVVLKVLDVVTTPWQLWFEVIKKIAGFLKENLPRAFEVLKGVAETVGAAFLAPFKALWDLIEKIIGAIKKIKLPHLPDLNPFGRSSTTAGGATVVGSFANARPLVVQVSGIVGDSDTVISAIATGLDRYYRRVGVLT